ncbi:MAG: hypothetical protein IJ763_04575 [Lachnospiraceae bacterium]|nr:hypothetical protein [Lachnospiraceae bacterium]
MKENNNKIRNLLYRWLLYIVGLLVLALGIILNTKADYGVSPIISVPYSISQIGGFNFGNASFVMYLVLAIIEYLLKWKNFKLYDLLQIPLSVVFTRFFNIFGKYIPAPTTIPSRIICLVIAIILTGIGAAMSMNARLVPNPGDGIVQAISDRVKKSAGLCKNCLDISCVLLTCTIGLMATGSLVGVGIGTVAAMIGVGRVIAVYNHFFKDKTFKLMGLNA